MVPLRSKMKQAKEKKASKRKADDDDDNDAPEEIQNANVKMQELRQLHEAMLASVSKKRAKKNTEKVKLDANKELSSDMLEGLADEDLELNDVGRDEDEEDEEEEEEEETADKEDKWKSETKIDITARSSSKKFGHVSVSALDKDNAVDAFIKSSKGGGAKRTLELVASTQARTRFGIFAAQKKKEPAMVFIK